MSSSTLNLSSLNPIPYHAPTHSSSICYHHKRLPTHPALPPLSTFPQPSPRHSHASIGRKLINWEGEWSGGKGVCKVSTVSFVSDGKWWLIGCSMEGFLLCLSPWRMRMRTHRGGEIWKTYKFSWIERKEKRQITVACRRLCMSLCLSVGLSVCNHFAFFYVLWVCSRM